MGCIMLQEWLTRIMGLISSGLGLLLAGCIGWWISSYFQAAKTFFDSKRVAYEQLVAHLAKMLALASRWAQSRVRGADGRNLLEEYDRHVEQTWVLIGQVTLYAKPEITKPFIDIGR